MQVGQVRRLGRALPRLSPGRKEGLTGALPAPQVLELYDNAVSSMECLCARPPPGLQHLGLGHNKLLGPQQSLYLTAEHW